MLRHRAILDQWNLHYYYDGCVSWSWYYPHHFTPWITDIRGFTNMQMNFELSKPFRPFEQLMAVLPSASRAIVPPSYHSLMTSAESPIIDYYPVDFEQDLNGKQQEWEAVVMIPFTTVERSHARLSHVDRSEWDVPIHKLKKGLMDGVRLDVFFPGFPTLKHILHTARLSKAGVRVFEQSSRGENMLLSLEPQGRPEVREVARALLGSEVWVGWPHLVEAMVVAVETQGIYIDAKGESNCNGFEQQARAIEQQYSGRYGVSVGKTAVVVHACPMSGRKFVMAATKGRITLEKQWHNISQPYALQAIVKDILVEDKQFQQYCSVEELFPPDTTTFMLGNPHYGAQGSVIKIDPEHKGRIQLKFEVPDLAPVVAAQSSSVERYEVGFKAAKQLAMSGHVMSRITGTVYMVRGAREQQTDSASKSNIGLNLKFNKRAEEVCGFTRKVMDGGREDGQWQYSRRCVMVLREYQQRFPEVFDYVAAGNASNDMFHELDVFPGPEGPEQARELVAWLEARPWRRGSSRRSRRRRTCSTCSTCPTSWPAPPSWSPAPPSASSIASSTSERASACPWACVAPSSGCRRPPSRRTTFTTWCLTRRSRAGWRCGAAPDVATASPAPPSSTSASRRAGWWRWGRGGAPGPGRAR